MVQGKSAALEASFVYTGGALWAGKNESRKRNILCRDRRRAARLTAEGLAFAAKLQTSWRRSHVLPTCTSRFKQRLLAFLPASHELARLLRHICIYIWICIYMYICIYTYVHMYCLIYVYTD
jgi:hypothetical protein